MTRFIKSTLWILMCTATSFSQAAPRVWDLNDVTYIFPVPSAENESIFLKGSDFIPQSWLTKDLARSNGLHLNLIEKTWAPLVSAQYKRESEEREALAERENSRINSEIARHNEEVRRSQTGQLWQQRQRQQHQDYGLNIPFMTVKDQNALGEAAFYELKLVAFRIDPCFKDQFFDKCRKQIRAVWQPLRREVQQQQQPQGLSFQTQLPPQYRLEFQDAAVHTFYDLTDEGFSRLLQKLNLLKQKFGINTQGLVLGVHPGLQNLDFFHDLQRELKKHIPSSEISRIAFLQENQFRHEWTFSSLDVVKGKLKPIIPAHLINPTIEVKFDRGERRKINPASIPVKTPHRDQIYNIAFQNWIQNYEGSLHAALRVENPNVHLPGTIDCVSCHVAPQVKEKSLKALSGAGEAIKARFQFTQKGYNLKNEHPVLHSEFRALGYTGTNLEISDRVINESAAVAEQLNRLLVNQSQTGVIK